MPRIKKQLPAVRDPREEMVAQGNDLIRRARFQLTTLEQDIIYFCLSKVKPTDKDFMRLTFGIKEFCEVCGIEPGGHQYRRIKATVKATADKSSWVLYANGDEELVRWFDTYKISRKEGTITAVLSQSIKPYLIGLIERVKAGGDGYTQAHLTTFLALQSKYGKRLYEILKSYLYVSGSQEKLYAKQIIGYDLEEIKEILNAETYERYQDLRRKVLEVAVREINEVTDIHVEYAPVKRGRGVAAIEFIYQHKPIPERMAAEQKARKRIKKGEDK